MAQKPENDPAKVKQALESLPSGIITNQLGKNWAKGGRNYVLSLGIYLPSGNAETGNSVCHRAT